MLKTTVLFLHSAGPQGQLHGSSQLIADLEPKLRHRFRLVCPEMPEPENPKYVCWKEQLDKELNALTGDVLVVGHSLGGSAALKYVSEQTRPLNITSLFMVASPFWGLDGDWPRNDFVLQHHFEQQLSHIPRLFLYHSRDDDIVPFTHLEAYAEKLPQAVIRKLDGGRHLFHAGIPELIQDIDYGGEIR